MELSDILAAYEDQVDLLEDLLAANCLQVDGVPIPERIMALELDLEQWLTHPELEQVHQRKLQELLSELAALKEEAAEVPARLAKLASEIQDEASGSSAYRRPKPQH